MHRVSTLCWFKVMARDAIIRWLTTNKEVVNENAKTVFIVGCGHSGTTLLANRLGLHPDVYTYPSETNIYLPGMKKRICASSWFSLGLEILVDCNKKILIEKTPKHVHVIDEIHTEHPKSLILGLARNPLDNIASLKSRFGDLNFSIERWLIDNTALLNAVARHDVTLLRYEDLVENYSQVLETVFELMCLPPVDIRYIEDQAQNRILSPKTENQKVRFKEVARGIENKIGASASKLSAKEKAIVIRKTRLLAIKLGYSLDYLEKI